MISSLNTREEVTIRHTPQVLEACTLIKMGQVAIAGEIRDAYNILGGNPGEKTSL
jgi:hypothetical protein